MSGIVPASTIPCPVRTPITGQPAGRMSRPLRRRWDARTADGLDFGGPTLTLWTARAALIIAMETSIRPVDAAGFAAAAGSLWGDLRIDNLHAPARSIRMPESEGDLGPGRFDRGGERLAEGEVPGDGRGEGAARAVEGFVKPTSAQAPYRPTVE